MRDTLTNITDIRYQGKNVGLVGVNAVMKDRIFVWNQEHFFSYGGGYTMSEGLLERLRDDEDVGLVYIRDCDKLVSIEDIESGRKITPQDKIFYNAEHLPSEPQFLINIDGDNSATKKAQL